MPKFYGAVGYAIPVETRPGYWTDKVEERNYYGDVLRSMSQWAPSQDSTNDDLRINNQISVVADPYAYNHCHSIKYVRYMDAVWKVTNVDPQRPRLILTLGGVYNGPTKS